MSIYYYRDDIATVNEDELIWVWWRKFLTKDFAGKNENSLCKTLKEKWKKNLWTQKYMSDEKYVKYEDKAFFHAIKSN